MPKSFSISDGQFQKSAHNPQFYAVAEKAQKTIRQNNDVKISYSKATLPRRSRSKPQPIIRPRTAKQQPIRPRTIDFDGQAVKVPLPFQFNFSRGTPSLLAILT